MSKYKLSTAQTELNLEGCRITVEHEDPIRDILSCQGQYSWARGFSCPFGGYGMFWRNDLIQVGDREIMLVNWYEHSRGGHTNPFSAVLNLDGKILWKQDLGSCDPSPIAFGEGLIWMVNSFPDDRKTITRPGYTGRNLECRQLANGELVRSLPVFLPDPDQISDGMKRWQQGSGLSITKVELAASGDEILLGMGMNHPHPEVGQERFWYQIELDQWLKSQG